MEALMPVMIIAFYAVYFLIILSVTAYGAASYVLEAVGLSAIARRRGIDKPWLAWIPVASSWLLGAVADRQLEARDGKDTKFRKLLLWCVSGVYACLALFWVCYASMFLCGFALGITDGEAIGFITLFILCYICLLGVSVLMSAVGMVNSVLTYLCCYFVYEACEPDRKVLYLVLSIVFGPAIFLFLCRDKGLPAPEEAAVLPEAEE